MHEPSFEINLSLYYQRTQSGCLGQEKIRQLRRFRDGYHLSETRLHKRRIDA